MASDAHTIIVEIVAGGILASLGATLTLLFKRLPKQMGQMSRDWYGQPERPGFPAVPGVPQRLQAVEDAQQDVKATLGELREFVVKIDHEVHPNSGLSIKDSVNRTDAAVAQLQADVSSIHQILKQGQN